jgi:hypothetical protein
MSRKLHVLKNIGRACSGYVGVIVRIIVRSLIKERESGRAQSTAKHTSVRKHILVDSIAKY